MFVAVDGIGEKVVAAVAAVVGMAIVRAVEAYLE